MIFYDSIKELPNSRRMLGQKYHLWGIGVGAEIDVVRDNIINAYTNIANNKTENALTLLQNAEFGIESIKSLTDWNTQELACYVKECEGKEYKHLTESDVDKITKYIDDNLTKDEITDKLISLKKKLK